MVQGGFTVQRTLTVLNRNSSATIFSVLIEDSTALIISSLGILVGATAK